MKHTTPKQKVTREAYTEALEVVLDGMAPQTYGPYENHWLDAVGYCDRQSLVWDVAISIAKGDKREVLRWAEEFKAAHKSLQEYRR